MDHLFNKTFENDDATFKRKYTYDDFIEKKDIVHRNNIWGRWVYQVSLRSNYAFYH